MTKQRKNTQVKRGLRAIVGEMQNYIMVQEERYEELEGLLDDALEHNDSAHTQLACMYTDEKAALFKKCNDITIAMQWMEERIL